MPPSKSQDARVRLSPIDRRQQLLRVTSDIIASDGVDNVRIPYVAAAAGITRPVVYKFFPNRQALIKGVLEDFHEEFDSRAPDTEGEGDVETMTRGFIEACCDTIEARGAGGWLLLLSPEQDAEIGALGRAVRRELVEPWLNGLRELTGVSGREAAALADMFLAGTGAILERWIDGKFSRKQVGTLCSRMILAVLTEFTE